MFTAAEQARIIKSGGAVNLDKKPILHRHKVAKAPNPLSMKKKIVKVRIQTPKKKKEPKERKEALPAEHSTEDNHASSGEESNS